MLDKFFALFLLVRLGSGLNYPDHVANQMVAWQKEFYSREYVTNELGLRLPSMTASLAVGDEGPLVLHDSNLIDHLAHFDRERIPERVVHGKGGGAFGYFEVTHDISNITKACLFDKVGKRTPLFLRFSVFLGEYGSHDTVRDPRGVAIKFYTEQGIWDLVANSLPIFYVRDPILFPSLVHSHKRNPATHLRDVNAFWDFATLRPESTHMLSMYFGDRGIPEGCRHMHGYSGHAFKFVNHKGQGHYVKVHLKTNQGIINLERKNATYIARFSPDFALKDLFLAILSGDLPSWNVSIQVMSFEQAKNYKYNPFDVTKVWLQGDFPLIPVGKLVLNYIPKNFFVEQELVGFSPANMIPGIEPSPDKMLQGRIFAYKDAQRYRLGTNFEQFSINRNPQVKDSKLRHYNRDGSGNQNTYHDGKPTYFPNSFDRTSLDPEAAQSVYNACGDVMRKDTGDEDNYSQADLFWTKVLKPDARQRLCENIAAHASTASEKIRKRIVAMFMKVNKDYGNCVKCELDKAVNNPDY